MFAGLLFAYIAGIFTLSHVTGKTLASLGIDIWDKGAHFVQYVPVGFLVAGFVAHREGRRRGWIPAVLALVILVGALGAIDEVHQGFVPGRTSSFLDAVADLLGGILGGGVSLFIFRRRINPSPS